MFAGKYDGENVFVQTNEDGLRTSYSRAKFTSLRTRIIVMGDSFAFGREVRQDKVWPQLLEDALRRRFQRDDIGVLNAGVVSYSPILQVRQFDKLLQFYRPHLVILLLDPTDIGDDHKYAEEFETGKPPVAVSQQNAMPAGIWVMSETLRAQIWSALVFPADFFCRHLFQKDPAADTAGPDDYYRFRIDIDGSVETNRFFIYRHPLEKTRGLFDSTWSNVLRIAGASQKLGSEFVLVPNPRFHHWNKRECPENWEGSHYLLDEPYQFEFFRYFLERGGSSQIQVFNILDAFRATTEFPLVLKNDPHWNEAGHSFVGRSMEDYIARNYASTFDGAATSGR